MAGEVRYCTAEDGVRLAYRMDGAGPFVIFASNFISISRLRSGVLSPLAEMIQRQFTVVRYDQRGMGLSDREDADYSLERRVGDLLAIATCVGAERFVLVGELYAAAVSIAFAARYPERVGRLVLRDPFASGERYYAETDFGRVATATTEITVEQWDFISQTIMARGAAAGVSGDDIARRAESLRASWEPERFLAGREAIRQFDVTDALAKVRAKTLVVRISEGAAQHKFAREVAASIPDAQLLVGISDRGVVSDETNRQIAEFVGADLARVEPTGDAAVKPAPASPVEGMAVVLFVDVVDSTGLTERMGDAAFRSAARALDEGMRTAMTAAGGSVVEGKVLGDGVMGVFGSASAAIAAALRCVELSAASELRLHVGVHAGDVIHEGGNVYGGAVNVASRVCGLSAPGEILVSGTVRELARTSAGVGFEDRGERELKGVGEAVRVYAVRTEDG